MNLISKLMSIFTKKPPTVDSKPSVSKKWTSSISLGKKHGKRQDSGYVTVRESTELTSEQFTMILKKSGVTILRDEDHERTAVSILDPRIFEPPTDDEIEDTHLAASKKPSRFTVTRYESPQQKKRIFTFEKNPEKADKTRTTTLIISQDNQSTRHSLTYPFRSERKRRKRAKPVVSTVYTVVDKVVEEKESSPKAEVETSQIKRTDSELDLTAFLMAQSTHTQPDLNFLFGENAEEVDRDTLDYDHTLTGGTSISRKVTITSRRGRTFILERVLSGIEIEKGRFLVKTTTKEQLL